MPLDNHVTESAPDGSGFIHAIALLLQHLPEHILINVQNAVTVCNEVLTFEVVQLIQKTLIGLFRIQLPVGLQVGDFDDLVLLLIFKFNLTLNQLICCGQFRNLGVNERIVLRLIRTENRVKKLLLVLNRGICKQVGRFQQVWVFQSELCQLSDCKRSP